MKRPPQSGFCVALGPILQVAVVNRTGARAWRQVRAAPVEATAWIVDDDRWIGRRDEDVRRRAAHRDPLALGRVAGADRHR
jgi:hypothetical protein